MSWYSDGEPFGEYDPPYCKNCKHGFTKSECDRCQAWHEAMEMLTMLMNDRERKICEKYSAYDECGFVHCNECPLNKGNPNQYDFRCKANCHYNRKTGEWEYDG